jgi:hypothetical protein
MFRLFTEHPRSVNETYLEHLCFASTFGGRMLAGGLACVAHGLLPFLFTTTGSRTVLGLYDRMNKARAQAVKAWSGPDRRATAPEPEYLI